MKWVVKSANHLKVDENNKVAILTLRQKRRFAGMPKDDVLILEKVNDNWSFSSHYKIDKVEVQGPELNKDTDQRIGLDSDAGTSATTNPTTTISLTLVSLLKDKDLLDYIFSLRRITNYRNPIRHFRGKYNRISNTEFEAIINDKVYWKRTIIGTILDALHPDHQKSFIAFAARQSPSILMDNANMDMILKQLAFYIDNAIIKPALYLQESARILREHLIDEVFAVVGFSEGPEPSSSIGVNSISEQAKVIQEYLQVMPSIESWLSIEENSDSRRFDKLFKNTGLPLTLQKE